MVEDQPKLFKKTLNMMWLAMVGKRIQPLLSRIAGLMNDERGCPEGVSYNTA